MLNIYSESTIFRDYDLLYPESKYVDSTQIKYRFYSVIYNNDFKHSFNFKLNTFKIRILNTKTNQSKNICILLNLTYLFFLFTFLTQYMI